MSVSLWAIVAALSGQPNGSLSPYPFHVLNWLLHGANAVLVFILLKSWLRLRGTALESGDGAQKVIIFAAAAGALLWSLHPMQVEAVAWITGLKDVLGGFFSLCSLAAFLCARETQSGASSRRWLGLATMGFVTALLCKPSAIAVSLVALLLEAQLPKPRREIFLALPMIWLALGTIVMGVTETSQTAAGAVATPVLTGRWSPRMPWHSTPKSSLRLFNCASITGAPQHPCWPRTACSCPRFCWPCFAWCCSEPGLKAFTGPRWPRRSR